MFDDSYERLEEIGSGTYGKVHKVRSRNHPQTEYAAKFQSQNDSEGRYHLLKEIVFLKWLNHPHIVPLHEVFWKSPKSSPIILTPLYPFSLKKYQEKCPPLEWPFALRIQYLYGLASALNHMHRLYISHRDLKPANILIDPNTHDIRLIDFGMTRWNPPDIKYSELQVHNENTLEFGTFLYRAPEIYHHGIAIFTCSVDIWSLGAIFYEWLTGMRLWDVLGTELLNLYTNTSANEFRFKFIDAYVCHLVEFRKESKYTKEVYDLLESMLHRDPILRISASDILSYIETHFSTEMQPYFDRKNADMVKADCSKLEEYVEVKGSSVGEETLDQKRDSHQQGSSDQGEISSLFRTKTHAPDKITMESVFSDGVIIPQRARFILLEWLEDLAYRQQLHPVCFFLSAFATDTFFHKVAPLSINVFCATGFVCLQIASILTSIGKDMEPSLCVQQWNGKITSDECDTIQFYLFLNLDFGQMASNVRLYSMIHSYLEHVSLPSFDWIECLWWYAYLSLFCADWIGIHTNVFLNYLLALTALVMSNLSKQSALEKLESIPFQNDSRLGQKSPDSWSDLLESPSFSYFQRRILELAYVFAPYQTNLFRRFSKAAKKRICLSKDAEFVGLFQSTSI